LFASLLEDLAPRRSGIIFMSPSNQIDPLGGFLLESDLYYLTTYLSYPQELQPFIYTTNALERFAKEVKRRAKVIESFSHPEAEEKVLLIVTEQMNESYRKRILPDWHISRPALEKMRKEKYGTEVRSEEALVEV